MTSTWCPWRLKPKANLTRFRSAPAWFEFSNNENNLHGVNPTVERGAAELLEIQDTCKNVRRQSFEKLYLSVIIATNMDSLDDYDYRLPKELIAAISNGDRGGIAFTRRKS